MKKLTAFLFTLLLLTSCVTACGAAANSPADRSNILVAYFSCTGTTESIAGHIAGILGADRHKITPAVPYTTADLDYNNPSSRANREQNDANARPAISGALDHIGQYDAIFIGYPIWWGQAPKIISSFLESCDFTGKTVIPFCTSGSSGIGSSASNLHSLASGADWLDGRRFGGGSSEAEVQAWIDTLELPGPVDGTAPEIQIDKDRVTVSNAPENSTLILAFYQAGILCNVGQKTGSGTIVETISDKAVNSDTVKAFLWDMETLRPLCDMTQIETRDSAPMRMKAASNEYEIIYELNDSQAAKELYAQLPLTLEVEDYGTNEKIFYPPEKLDIADAPVANAGKGTLAYFAPWGDVVMFYDRYDPNSSLYELGQAVSGMDDIEQLTGTITLSAWNESGGIASIQ